MAGRNGYSTYQGGIVLHPVMTAGAGIVGTAYVSPVYAAEANRRPWYTSAQVVALKATQFLRPKKQAILSLPANPQSFYR
jgi:hypothetical protein